MSRGQQQTSSTAEAAEVHQIIKRNASEADLIQAKAERIHTSIPIGPYLYHIQGFYLDDLYRLIAICILDQESGVPV